MFGRLVTEFSPELRDCWWNGSKVDAKKIHLNYNKETRCFDEVENLLDGGVIVVEVWSIIKTDDIGQVLCFEWTGWVIGDRDQKSLRYCESGVELVGEFNRSMKDFENILFLKKWKMQYIFRLDDGRMRFF